MCSAWPRRGCPIHRSGHHQLSPASVAPSFQKSCLYPELSGLSGHPARDHTCRPSLQLRRAVSGAPWGESWVTPERGCLSSALPDGELLWAALAWRALRGRRGKDREAQVALGPRGLHGAQPPGPQVRLLSWRGRLASPVTDLSRCRARGTTFAASVPTAASSPRLTSLGPCMVAGSRTPSSLGHCCRCAPNSHARAGGHGLPLPSGSLCLCCGLLGTPEGGQMCPALTPAGVPGLAPTRCARP